MAAPALPDLQDVMFHLLQLERRETGLVAILAKAEARHATFPNVISERQIAAMSAELVLVKATLDGLRAQLVPLSYSAAS
jgi:hypothetical protein